MPSVQQGLKSVEIPEVCKHIPDKCYSLIPPIVSETGATLKCDAGV